MQSGSQVVLEGKFDKRVISYVRVVISLFMAITVVGIPFIPFWLLFSLKYGPEFYGRLFVRLTPRTLEIRKGVYFRKEITIPLNRITDVRLHDDPIMRSLGIRGLKVETAGQAGQGAGTEGDLIGLIDAVEFRDAILRERERSVEGVQAPAAPTPTPSATTPGDTDSVLTEIRDILARIESKG